MPVFDRDPKEIAAAVQRLKQQCQEYRALSGKAADAMEQGDRATAVMLFAESLEPLLGGLGLDYQLGDPSKPYQKKGAAEAAVVVTKVAARLLDPQRDAIPVSLSQLDQQGRFLAVADTLSTAADTINNRIAVVANPVYDLARDGIIKVNTAMQPKIAASPALQREMEPVTRFLEERNEKAAESRDRARALQAEADKKAEERLGAEARDSARKDAALRVTDAMSVLVKKD